MGWVLTGAFCVLLLLVLLGLYRVWLRRYGPESAGQLLRTRLRVTGVGIATLLLMQGLSHAMDFETLFNWMAIPIAILCLMSIPWMVSRRRRLGRVLLQVPQVRFQRIMVGVGAIYVLLGSFSLYSNGWSVFLAVNAGLVALFLSLGATPAELREGGIAAQGDARKWSDLTYHGWHEGKQPRLEVRFRPRWWTGASVIIPVAPDQRSRVTEILRMHGPQASAAVQPERCDT
jgi:hypothetical protein